MKKTTLRKITKRSYNRFTFTFNKPKVVRVNFPAAAQKTKKHGDE